MPVYNLTFQQWLDGVLNSPINAPKQAITLTYNATKNKYVLLKYAVEPPKNTSKQADIQIALAQGDTEEIRDLRGINTELALKDLVGKPLDTIKEVLNQTKDDIFNIDELGSIKSARVMGNIVRGKTVDEDGNDLAKPTSFILKTMGVTYPSLVKAGLHEYQLLVDSTPSQPKASYTDRRSVEVGEDINPAFATYTNQANSMHAMAESDEIASSRLIYRNQNYQNFNRTALRELELNLAHTFNHSIAGGRSITGALTTYLKQNGHLPSPADVNYNNEMAGLLGITPAEFANPARFSEGTRRYLHSVLESEAQNIRINADPYLGQKINSTIPTQLGFTPGNYPSWMFNITEEIEVTQNGKKVKILKYPVIEAWDSFIGRDPKTGDILPLGIRKRMEAYDELRNRYISSGRIGEWRKIAVSDLGLEINSKRYGGIRMTNLYEEDLNFLYQRKLVESYMLFENHAAEIKRDIYNAATNRTGNANDGRLALARFDASINNLRLSNNMFFASTTKEILENLRDGKFMSNAFVVSRFFNTLPFVDEEFRNLRAYTKIINPDTYLAALEKTKTIKWLGSKVFGKEVENPLTDLPVNVARVLGIGFEGELPTTGTIWAAQKIFGKNAIEKVFENRDFIYYQRYRATNVGGATRLVPSGAWKAIGVRSSQVTGLFGDNSVFQILQEMQSFKMLNGVMTIGVEDFVANPNNLQSLLNAMRTVSTAGPGYTPLNAFEQLSIQLGFGHGGARLADVKKFLDNFDKVLRSGGAMDWLQGLANSGKLSQGELWSFMQTMVQNGSATSLVQSKVIGPLQIFNRYANAVNNFLYKNVLWGEFLSGVPGVSSFRGFLRNYLGMSEEIGLARAATNWAWVRRLRLMGKALSKMSLNQGTSSAAVGQRALGRLIGGRAATFIGSKIASSAAFSTAARSLAFILNGAAGIVTGGITFALTTIASISFKASLRLMRGDLRGAGKSVKEDLLAISNLIKKLIIFPLMLILGIPCGCFIALIFFVAVLIPAMIAPYEELTGGVSSVINSEMIRVEKTANRVFFGSTIEYKITVENIAENPVTISLFEDKLVRVGPCDASGNPTSNASFGEPGFIGKLSDGTTNDIQMDLVEAQFLGKILNPGESFSFKFSLYDFDNGEGATYFNTVKVGVAEEPTKSATDSTNTPINGGGCSVCPSGWPVSGPITQGPNGSFSHGGTEAVDFGIPTGTPVHATHDGTVSQVGTGWSDGYGNFIAITAPQGYTSLYAHLSFIGVNVGDTIAFGQEIGLSGDTGNSTGPHLHYEFRKSSGTYPECFPGQPVLMQPPYAPAEINSWRGR